MTLKESRTPGGVVRINECRSDGDTATPFAEMNSATLRDVLDGITILDPQYRWQVDNGVVNLVPRLQPLPELLNTRIKKFEVKDATGISYMLSELQSLPEVREQVVKLNLSQALQWRTILPLYPQKRYDISCEDVTLQEALNAIVRTYGRGVWEYKETHCPGQPVEYSLHFISG
jgi:hypothetical protein